jgi:FkbM family methyltransferase
MRPNRTPGYSGLHGEVVTEDIYHLRDLPFVPDLIFDIGANVGVFTRYAASLFPDAKIISVEPHPPNFESLQWDQPANAVLLNVALGRGKIWRPLTAANGSGECYLGEYLGFPEGAHDDRGSEAVEGIDTVTVQDLFDTYRRQGMKTVVKIDCEGAEQSIFDHEPSMEALRRAEYVAMEVHNYSSYASDNHEVRMAVQHQLDSFQPTHECSQEHVMFYALMRGSV